MLADERGRRTFSFVDVEHALPRVAPRSLQASSSGQTEVRAEREISFRFVVDNSATAEAVLSVVGAAMAQGVGLRTHGIVTGGSGTGGAGDVVVVDVVASRDHARGGMARRAPRLIIATAAGVASAGAVVALHEGAVLGVLSAEPSGILPEAARTVVRERRARVLPLAIGAADERGDPAYAIAAVAAGAALAAASRALKTPIDGGAAARYVGDAVPDAEKEAAGPRARRAFEATRDLLSAAAREDAGEGAPPGRPIGVA
jgi:hypothetical protein